MPKYGIHHVVITDSMPQLLASPAAAARTAGEELAKNRVAANLGAIGPDLFFWAPDYELVDRFYTLYKNIHDVVELYRAVVKPFRDIHDAVEAFQKEIVGALAPSTVQLIEELIQRARQTAELYKSTIQTGLLAGVISGANLLADPVGFDRLSRQLFQLFKPPLQDGDPESKWYWFDMLHYRRTGNFGRQLVKNARGGSAQARAYAYGYLSHIATDLVGHPYVNQIAAGPYRLQVQRHVTVENYMDTWKFRAYYGGESINLKLFSRLGLDDAAWEALPKEIGDLLHKTLADVYRAADHPLRVNVRGGADDGFLTREQIDQTYEIFRLVLKFMTDQTVEPPEEPFSAVKEILAEALKDFFEPPPAPPASLSACSWEDILALGATAASRACYEDFFKQLARYVKYVAELVVWMFETIADLFNLIVSALLALPVTVLLALLYGVQLALYAIYQSVRSVLALEGFIFPEPTDLDTAHGRNLTTPFLCWLGGCPSQGGYPRWADLGVSHLICPTAADGELPNTLPNLDDPGAGPSPDSFISEGSLNLANLDAYARAKTPAETRDLNRRCLRIGNATELTAFMIGTAAEPGAPDAVQQMSFANWNLDADRSYGAKTWNGVLPKVPMAPVTSEEHEKTE